MTNSLLNIQLAWIRHTLWKPFLEKTKNPKAIQIQLLQSILKKNRHTVYGYEHLFSEIKTYEQYIEQVPINEFEDLQSYIAKSENSKEATLTKAQALLYMQTSGTTDNPKNIPLTRSSLRALKKSQAVFALAHHTGIKNIFDGSILAISGSHIEGTLDNGKPFGSMSGLIGECMPHFLKKKYLVPDFISKASDYQLKYLLIAALALAERDITWMVSANPTTFFKLVQVIEENLPGLIEVLETGTSKRLPEDFRRYGKYRFIADKDRVRELKTLSRASAISFKQLWPNLKAVTTWTGGNCSLLIPKLKQLVSRETRVIELGYIASEFRGSLNVDVTNNVCVPTFNENFFEFIEPTHWDAGDRHQTKTLDQLEIGKQYYVIATTRSGLYRYFINDIVEITGRFNQTPQIHFVQKGKGITNLTGEKLTEFQVIKAMDMLARGNGLGGAFFILFADPQTLQYRLFIESHPYPKLSKRLDRALSEINIEFTAKLKSGRLLPTQVTFLKQGCAEAYKQHCLAEGQRENQFKTVRLQNMGDCSFDFQPHVLPPE